MTTSNLTARVLDVLSDTPATSIDVWDALGDPDLRFAQVSSELHALAAEGKVAAYAGLSGPAKFARAQAVTK